MYYGVQPEMRSQQVPCFTGELLQTLSHDKLPPAGVSSIRDGTMAVPGWDDNKLCLFKII